MGTLVYKTPQVDKDNRKLRSALSKTISKRIRQIRKKRGLTQQQLAEQAGLHLTYVGHLELGKYHPSAFVLWKIANVLKVKLDDLVG